MRASNVGFLTIVVVGFYLICCAVAMGQTGARETPRPATAAESQAAVPQTPVERAVKTADLMAKHNGSLLRASLEAAPDASKAQVADVSFFSVPPPQPKTIKKHDLVTIIVREESEFSSTGSTELKKQAAINAQLEQFIRFNLKNFKGIKGDAITNPLGVKASGDATWKGEGTVDRTDTFTARVQAEVVDVKPNGTLVLQGSKSIKNDEEEQRFTVTGICRAEDLTPDNSVLSTQLLDLNLDKQTKGSVQRANKKGWMTKLLDAVNPF